KWAELQAGGWESNERFYFEPAKRRPRKEGESGWGMPSWAAPDVADDELTDGRTASAAIAALPQLKAGGLFFLAVGFLKPHLPFVAPKRYYDLYPEAMIAAAERQEAPDGGAPS